MMSTVLNRRAKPRSSNTPDINAIVFKNHSQFIDFATDSTPDVSIENVENVRHHKRRDVNSSETYSLTVVHQSNSNFRLN